MPAAPEKLTRVLLTPSHIEVLCIAMPKAPFPRPAGDQEYTLVPLSEECGAQKLFEVLLASTIEGTQDVPLYRGGVLTYREVSRRRLYLWEMLIVVPDDAACQNLVNHFFASDKAAAAA